MKSAALVHQIEDHRKTLDAHIDELKSIQKNGANATGRLRALTTLIDDIDHELVQCRHTIDLLNQYQPSDQDNNILRAGSYFKL